MTAMMETTKTKTARAAAAERTIATQTQEEEEEEEAEIIGQYFFSKPAPLPSSALTDLKLDKRTMCMW